MSEECQVASMMATDFVLVVYPYGSILKIKMSKPVSFICACDQMCF